MSQPLAADPAQSLFQEDGPDRAGPPALLPRTAVEALCMRQLRHQTKNAWQRILWELSRTGGEECSLAAIRRLAALEQRVCLAAEISDALFGFSRAPAPIVDRLRALGTSMVALLGGEAAQIGVDVAAHGVCPPALHTVIIRVAHEMIGNAVKHGLTDRRQGNISIRLFSEARQVRLVVANDGRGLPPGQLSGGQGIGLMQEMATEHDGTITLRQVGHLTAAELVIPVGVGDLVSAGSRPGPRQGDGRPDLRVV